ncbi:MBOAT family O-acyltransferase [Endothiovibrio diazotrophicus]
MLFSSELFIFLFLPAALIGYQLVRLAFGAEASLGFLVAASLLFYGWWHPPHVVLIVVSVTANYGLGRLLSRASHDGGGRGLLTLGVVLNLLLLGYYKYAGFIAGELGWEGGLGGVVLPLAISFFTFQQIAYLVDVHRGEVRDPSFLHFSLFVLFFPQLIAGPIVHHKEIIPQFVAGLRAPLAENLSVGLTLFVIGLVKKVVLADGVEGYATPLFDAAEGGTALTAVEAWGGALAYAFQIYFDFSGYSDMALGVARMFGIRLPLNFASPYKAASIIDFWRRWHITLSRFLRDYLYIPLGGNRRGRARHYLNLAVTMLLGGLWHGAAWTFVAWGALHGLLLGLNQLWRRGCALSGIDFSDAAWWRWGARLLTFATVTVAWVVFRADSFAGAERYLWAMFGGNGAGLDFSAAGRFANLGPWFLGEGVLSGGRWASGWAFAAILGALWWMVWSLPNAQQLLRLEGADGEARLRWRPSPGWASAVWLGFVLCSFLLFMRDDKVFIYFQF